MTISRWLVSLVFALGITDSIPAVAQIVGCGPIRESASTGCVARVCTDHPECCSLDECGPMWNEDCEDYYAATCPYCRPTWTPPNEWACSAGSGNCNTNNGSPGCNSVTCCTEVCAIKPECCTGIWTRECAAAALGVDCGFAYDGHAVNPYPGTTILESEACGASTNNPVSSATCAVNNACRIANARTVHCGDRILGSVFRNGTTADTDVYYVAYDPAYDLDGDGRIKVAHALRTEFLYKTRYYRRSGSSLTFYGGGSPMNPPLNATRDMRFGSNFDSSGQMSFAGTTRLPGTDGHAFEISAVSTTDVPGIANIGCALIGGTYRGTYYFEVQCADDGAPWPDAIEPTAACDVVHDGPGCTDPYIQGATCWDDASCCSTGWDVECVANRHPWCYYPVP